MTRAQIARENFLSGYNCAQAVLLAFADLVKVDRETLENIARPFGGGFARLREVCGTVSGAAMTMGLLFPEKSKSELYALVQAHANAFKEQNGSYLCRELLDGAGVRAETAPTAETRTAAYYHKRPCAELCACSAAILEELCAQYGKI